MTLQEAQKWLAEYQEYKRTVKFRPFCTIRELLQGKAQMAIGKGDAQTLTRVYKMLSFLESFR